MTPELAPDILLSAYAQGIFPMGNSESDEIRWFSPDPRAILELDALRVSRSLRQIVRQERFAIRINRQFEAVMRRCADRPEGTWITKEIIEAYKKLHDLGFAHSVEAYQDETLAGGLYGVTLGGVFFGESMFHSVRDASKVALVWLVRRMKQKGFVLLDVQFLTAHLAGLGATEIPRAAYLERLVEGIRLERLFADEVDVDDSLEDCR